MRLNAMCVVVLALLLGACHGASTPESGTTIPKPSSNRLNKYKLELVSHFNGRHIEYAFVIDDKRFKSIESLETFLAGLPLGAELTWAPGCVRRGGEPLLSSITQMNDFRSFLKRRGIKFTLIPSG